MRITSHIFAVINLFIFVFSLFFNEYDLLIYASMIVSILMVLDKLGKGIVLREVIALFNSLIYLFMPLMGYLFYTRSNPIAASFVRFMPVSKSTYFDLALPAVTGFILLLCWPIRSSYGDEGDALKKIIDNGKKRLAGNQRIGIGLLIVGVVISFIIQYLPVSLQYVFTLFYFSSYGLTLGIYF